MMKKNKLIAAALSASILFSAMPLTAYAAESEPDNVYEDEEAIYTFHDVTRNFNEIAEVRTSSTMDEAYNYFDETYFSVNLVMHMEMGYTRVDKETGWTYSEDCVEMLRIVDAPDFDADQPGDYDYYFTCNGEQCKIQIHLVQDEPYVTDLKIEDAEMKERGSFNEPNFTAVVHRNGEAVPVSNIGDDLDDSGEYEYAKGLIIENRSDFSQLEPGVYTMKARYLDAEAEFKLTVTHRPRITDFELETAYDEYCNRRMVRFKSFTIDGEQVIDAKDAAFYPLMGSGSSYFSGIELLGEEVEYSRPIIAEAEYTCTFGDDTPWTVGEHTLTVTLNDTYFPEDSIVKSVHYRVNESAIDHIEVDDLIVSENEIRREEMWGETWEYLEKEPDYRIYYKDGTVFDSRDESVGGGNGPLGDDTQINIHFEVDNPHEHTWSVGVYHAVASVTNRMHADIPELTTPYRVIVEAAGEVAAADANADGAVNIIDATYVQLCAAGTVELTPKQAAAADLSGDGVVDVRDATLIQRQIAGLN